MFCLDTHCLKKLSPVLLGVLITGQGLIAAENSSVGYTWVLTDTVGPPKRPGQDYREMEVTPSVSTNIPNSQSFRNDAVALLLRLRESTVASASGSAFYGGKITIQYDVRALEDTNVKPKTRAETCLVWERGRPLLKAGYYRGRVAYPGTHLPSDDWLTIIAAGDKSRLVAVRDSGLITVSESAGSSWATIHRPGRHEFTLATTPKGSSFVAVVSIPDNAKAGAATASDAKTAKNWYCTASTTDGSQLVLTGGPSQSAPALGITRSGDFSILSWQASFTGFVLQQNTDLAATNWSTVTNSTAVFDGENQVILPVVGSRSFFRLTTR